MKVKKKVERFVRTEHIKADEVLFGRWGCLSYKIGSMKCFVQNDVEVNELEFREWLRRVYALQAALAELIADTASHMKFNKDAKGRNIL